MESEITQIEIKLPALEEEKKGFVQSKNFKEAGRVSNELKASIQKKEKNAEIIEKNKNDIEILNQQLKEFDSQIEKLKEEKKENEKELNKLRYHYLNDNLKTMNSYLSFNTSNNDLLEEISITKEDINNLLEIDYIKEIYDKEKENENKENNIEIQNDLVTQENKMIEENNNEINNEVKEEEKKVELTKEEIEEKIKELNEEIEKAVNVKYIYLFFIE